MGNKRLLFIRFIIVFIAITLGGLLMFQDAFSKAEQKWCNFHLRDDISKDDFSNLFSSMKKEGLIGRSTGYMSIGNLVMGPEEDIQKIADKARQQWGEDAVVEIKYFEPTPVPVEVTLTSAKKTYYYKEPLIFIVKIQNILKDKEISIFTGFYPEGRSVSFRIINLQKNIKYK
ncbi:MAG TPA: hypothetical protein ENG55_02120, partial [Candidatus Omnitrophica bacterium]|nr:hypothetical protein [Candidatus Omnitrophota bacterium]